LTVAAAISAAIGLGFGFSGGGAASTNLVDNTVEAYIAGKSASEVSEIRPATSP